MLLILVNVDQFLIPCNGIIKTFYYFCLLFYFYFSRSQSAIGAVTVCLTTNCIDKVRDKFCKKNKLRANYSVELLVILWHCSWWEWDIWHWVVVCIITEIRRRIYIVLLSILHWGQHYHIITSPSTPSQHTWDLGGENQELNWSLHSSQGSRKIFLKERISD